MNNPLSVLVNLADKQSKNLAAELGVSLDGLDFAEELAEIQKEALKEARKEAALKVMDLLRGKNKAIGYFVDELRVLRAKERQLKARIQEVERAEAYAKETNNWLPLALLLPAGQGGISAREISSDVDTKLLEIPKDWQPKGSTGVSKVE